jgi:tetratricopeptide (TPR) repeat protein/energy-coupling factor transporter ATP-binding protein EcfA2
VDDLLRRLRTSRFVAVVGTSGSGKSSLVRSGLIPSLQSGFMAGAGSSWRIAMLRPGEDPIGHLAGALDDPQVLGGDPELGDTGRMLQEVTLRRSSLGLVDAVRQARLPAGENVLVIVDQFEELFRFRESRQIANSRDEAIAFVRLLLEATARQAPSIYVVLTMRSDFIGDCMNFPGLPEAVNAGLYLVGRMTRDGVRAAITGPVAVAGGAIAPRLVNQVLNDLGDDDDQLPRVQHALSRTWAHWAQSRGGQGAIDVENYEAIGTFSNALSQHAEEAYEEARAAGLAELTARVFKALTDTVTDQRGVRRPTSVGTLAAITGAPEAEIVTVVEIFREPGRCFLMPPAAVPLTERSIIDLSHESLMRCWGRLITWAEEERSAARFYVRLSQASAWHAEGTAGLWRNPELELAQRWRRDAAPSPAWAARYDAGFDRAMAFLDESLAERDRVAAAAEHARRATLRRTQLAAGVLATLLVVAVALGIFAWRESQRAQGNLELARRAVDETLAAVDRDPAQIGGDVPQVQELRRELLAKAEGYYRAFLNQEPRNRDVRRDIAEAHLRLGHINRMLDQRDEAEREYRQAIAGLASLGSQGPASLDDRSALAAAYNWLGETLRGQVGREAEAAEIYDQALALQTQLVSEAPGRPEFQVALARTRSNRGILRYTGGNDADAERDFREALALLEPVRGTSARAQQDAGRAANNLAGLLDSKGRAEAETFYEQAVAAHEQLLTQHPDNSEYQIELATFSNNLAVFLHVHGEEAEALRHSRRAVELLTALARPAPSLGIERADAHNLRATILLEQDREAAMQAYAAALNQLSDLATAPAVTRIPMFHVRFGDLLVNLAGLARAPTAGERERRLLTRGLDQYIDVATSLADSGSAAEIQAAIDTLTLARRELGERDARRLLDAEQALRRAIGEPRPK